MGILIFYKYFTPRRAGQALRSLAYLSPVRDDMFVENNHNHENEPQRGDMFVNKGIDSYILLESSKDELNSFYQFLIDNSQLRFSINGHTDNMGTYEYNQDLSIKRAKSVYNWLINKGIQPSQLEYQGFGKKHPLVNSNDDKSKAINRRVEVQIINK